MKRLCKYCNKEIEFEKIQSFAGHVSNCKSNPEKSSRYTKIGNALRGRKRTSGVLKHEHKILCKKCNAEYALYLTPAAFKKGKFRKHCSIRCANEKPHSAETKDKLSKSANSYNLKYRVYMNHQHECPICKKIIFGKNKLCSVECYKQHMSILTSSRLSNLENRTNYNRYKYKRSYLEIQFENFLKDNNFNNFEIEKHFYNSTLNKNYFVDFIFEDKKLIIELDGTQHKKTFELDKQRDAYFNSIGYTVLRITYREFINNLKEKEVIDILAS